MKERLVKIVLSMVLAIFCTGMVPSTIQDINTKEIHNEIIINDADVGDNISQVSYSPEWKTSVGYPDSFYNGDEHWTNARDWAAGWETDKTKLPYLQVKFEGSKIEVYGNKDDGTGIYQVSIDGGEFVEIDGYSETALNQQLLFASPTLENAEHTLLWKLSGKKNDSAKNNYGEVDFFKVTQSTEYYTKLVEDSETTDESELFKFDYEGNWKAETGYQGMYSNGDAHYAHAGDFYEISFIGNYIELYGSKDSDHGICTVMIDGKTVGKIDAQNPSRINKALLFKSGNLGEGTHKIKVIGTQEAPNAKVIHIDYAKIQHGEIAAVDIAMPQDISLEIDEESTLSASVLPTYATEKLIWESENEAIASVNDKGNVVAKTVGNTKIYAVLSSGLKKYTEVKVVKKGAPLRGFVGSTDCHYLQSDYDSVKKMKDTSWHDTAWKNDEMSSELVLYTKNANVHNVKVSASDFKHNKAVIGKENIELSFLKEVSAFVGRTYGSSASSKPHVDVPDIIFNGDPVDLAANHVQPVWIQFHIPKDAVAGLYAGVISVTADELTEPIKFEYTFEIQDLVQPDPADYETGFELWEYPYAAANYYGIEDKDLYGEKHMAILENQYKPYAEAGGNTMTTWISEYACGKHNPYDMPSTVKWTKKVDGSFSFDYAQFDKWVDLNLKLGIDDKLKCFSMVPDWPVTFYNEASRAIETEQMTAGSARWKDVWGQFLDSFIPHLEEKGYFDFTYIALDEVGEANVNHVADLLQTKLNSKHQRLKLSVAVNYGSTTQSTLDRIDDISINLGYIDHTGNAATDLTADRRSKGLTTSIYTCVGDYPNSFARSNPSESAWSIWYSATKNFDGYLRWAYDNFVLDPYNSLDHIYYEAGDTMFVYPDLKDAENPKPKMTPRFQRMKEGLRDVEKIKYLKKMAPQYTDEIQKLVSSLGRRTGKADSYGGVLASSQEDKDYIDAEVNRMREGTFAIAKKYLDEQAVSVNKDALQALLVDCANKRETAYTVSSWTEFEKICEIAKALADDENATQADVDVMVEQLTKAMSKLLEACTDSQKSTLKELQGKFEALNPLLYSESDRMVIEGAITELKAALLNKDLTIAMADAMITTINDRLLKLPEVKLHKEELESLINKYSAYEKDKYTVTSWSVFEKALKDAQAIFIKEVTTQREIEQVMLELQHAANDLICKYLDYLIDNSGRMEAFGKFEEGTLLSVRQILGDEFSTEINKIENTGLVKKLMFEEIFAIRLLHHDVIVLPNGNVEIRIKIADKLLGKNLGIVYLQDGKMEYLDTIIQDGYLIFAYTHSSNYAIVSAELPVKDIFKNMNGEEKPAKGIDTGDRMHTTALLSLVIISLVASGILMLMKKKCGCLE